MLSSPVGPVGVTKNSFAKVAQVGKAPSLPRKDPRPDGLTGSAATAYGQWQAQNPNTPANWTVTPITPQPANDYSALAASGYTAASAQMLATIRERMFAAGMDVRDSQAQFKQGSRDSARLLKDTLMGNRYDTNMGYADDMAGLGAAGLGRSGLGMGIADDMASRLAGTQARARVDAAARVRALDEARRAAQQRMAITQAEVAAMRASEANAASLLANLIQGNR
jgi:hypothetical protein